MTHHLAIPIGPRDHVFGSRHASVVLVEYGDYECPYCGQAYPIVKELQRRFGDALAFVFRNFPLVEVHPHALRAAETAEWAGLARRFWPMHDYLFEHQDRLEPAALLEAVTGFELDRHQLQTAWHDRALEARVAEDMTSGAASGVSGTPTFFINGVRHDGSWELEDLAEAIAAAGRRP